MGNIVNLLETAPATTGANLPVLEFWETSQGHRLINWAELRVEQLYNYYADRLLENCIVDSVSKCWRYGGKVTNKGYVKAQIPPRKSIGGHRLVYLAKKGPIPSEWVVDHICHKPELCYGGTDCLHRRCLNPAHLEAVPHKVNASSERSRRERPGYAWRSEQTHCKYGHELTEDNVYRPPKEPWTRQCRACNRRIQAARDYKAISAQRRAQKNG